MTAYQSDKLMPEVEAVYRNIFSSRDKGEKKEGKATQEKLRY